MKLLEPHTLQLSIVVPSFNEALRLPPTLLLATDFLESEKVKYEIIVVDDGSTDETVSIVNKMQKLCPKIKIISLQTNKGKGAAVKAGLEECLGEIVGFMDADGASPIEEYSRLNAAIKQGADLAIGSRALASNDTQIKTVWYRKLLGRIFNAVVNFISVPGIKDTQCGFKFFKREAAQKIIPNLTCSGFSIDVEILLLAQKGKLKIAEVPINWVNIPGSKVNLIVDSSKMLRDVIKLRWKHSV